MAKSPEEALQTMISNMPEKTGKSLQAWLEVVSATELSKHGQIVKYLKSEHGMTHGFANLVARKATDAASEGPVDLLAAQYVKKPALRPIYETFVNAIRHLDADFSVKKTYVSLRRNKQFAILQPSTKTRLDVGINLRNVDPTDRLEASGSFNRMVTHRVRVHSVDEVDAELIGWLEAAYERA